MILHHNRKYLEDYNESLSSSSFLIPRKEPHLNSDKFSLNLTTYPMPKKNGHTNNYKQSINHYFHTLFPFCETWFLFCRQESTHHTPKSPSKVLESLQTFRHVKGINCTCEHEVCDNMHDLFTVYANFTLANPC